MKFIPSELLKSLNDERPLTQEELASLNDLIKVPVKSENIETCFQAIGTIALATDSSPFRLSHDELYLKCRIITVSMSMQSYDIVMKMVKIWFTRSIELDNMMEQLNICKDIEHFSKALFIYGFCYMSVMCGISCENHAERIMGKVKEYIHNVYMEVVAYNEQTRK